MPVTSPTAIVTPQRFLSGNGTRLIIETTGPAWSAFAAETIDVNESCETDRIDHTEAPGWASNMGATKMVSMTITFVIDKANPPQASIFGIKTGAYIKPHVILDFYATPEDPTPAKTEDYTGTVLVTGRRFTAGPKVTAVRMVCECVSTGVFTLPT